jgi:hypothetical protein
MLIVLMNQHEIPGVAEHEVARFERKCRHGPVAYAAICVDALTWRFNAGVNLYDDDLWARFQATEDLKVFSVRVDREQVATFIDKGVDVLSVYVAALAP